VKDTARKSIDLPLSLWERISDYRHAHKMRSERQAVETLLEVALEVKAPVVAALKRKEKQ
jgi:macrodomain Ter protein organizer (MatP/YcbG family)